MASLAPDDQQIVLPIVQVHGRVSAITVAKQGSLESIRVDQRYTTADRCSAMELDDITYQGPPVDDPRILGRLPADYRSLLTQVNGFVQFGGGLHIRGACHAPTWHALRTVWEGEEALAVLYPGIVLPGDVPFGQDAVGDQFLLRDDTVYRLAAETGDIESLACGLFAFLGAAQADPVGYLSLQPLLQFHQQGGTLSPGELLSVYPPFCFAESASGVSLRSVGAMDRLRFLAGLAAQIRGVAEQDKVVIRVEESADG